MKKVKAKITRTVTEIAFVLINDKGELHELVETIDELDCDNIEIIRLIED